MDAVILAGGFGTRLQQVVKDIPKPMAPVAGRPFLEYILDWLDSYNVGQVVLAVGYKKEIIMNHFGDLYNNVNIRYSIEDSPLGTGGAIKQALSMCQSKYSLVVNGDTYFTVNIRNMEKQFTEMNSDVLLAVKKLHNFTRYGTVEINSNNRITSFQEKGFCVEGYISGGVYILKHDILEGSPDAFSIEKDFLEKNIFRLNIASFRSDTDFIDIGIPEDYNNIRLLFEDRSVQ